MNGAIDPAAAQQRVVSGIDDGGDIEPGDIAFDDRHPLQYFFDDHRELLFRHSLSTFTQERTCATR